VGGPTVADAMRGIFRRRKSIEVLSPEPRGHQTAAATAAKASLRGSLSTVSSGQAWRPGGRSNSVDTQSARETTGPGSTATSTSAAVVSAVSNPIAHDSSRYDDIAEPPPLTLPPAHEVLARLQDEQRSRVTDVEAPEQPPLPRAASTLVASPELPPSRSESPGAATPSDESADAPTDPSTRTMAAVEEMEV
jgi:hypothetical protein